MSSTEAILVIVAIVIVLAAAVFGWFAYRRRALRSRFGPEYDRVVSERESVADAERELRDRERKHAELTLTPLTDTAREGYATAWQEVQVRFVDDPNAAVSEADVLVTRLIAERGYPSDGYDDQLAHLSVEHARTLGHYRDAHEINLRNERGEATTEELRQALVHYRELFADLLGEDPVDRPTPDAAGEKR